MPERPLDEHEWFRARLDPASLDLLDEAEAVRFAAHAAGCAACAAAWQLHRENSIVTQADGHIPTRLIARWDRSARRLRGLPRRLVREHLESCAACRQDLEALGYAPSLARDPQLEGENSEVPDPLPVARPTHEIRVVRGATPRERWRQIITGALAGAGAAAAAAWIMVPGIVQRSTPAPVARTESVPIELPLRSGDMIPSLRLEFPTRGEPPPTATLRVPPDSRFILIVLPEMFLADTTQVAVEVLDPGDERLVSVTHEAGRLTDQPFVVSRSGEPLRTGTYRLRIVTMAESATPVVVELSFELSVIPH